jgi:hypothetical protein
MAIYGPNFNGTQIPAEARFAKRIKVRSDGSNRSWLLVGVCNTPAEARQMGMQADNGRRQLMQVVRDGWIATYAG